MTERLAVAAARLLDHTHGEAPARWAFERGRASVIPVPEGLSVCVSHATFRLVALARRDRFDLCYFDGSAACAVAWTTQLAIALGSRRRAARRVDERAHRSRSNRA